MFSSREGGMEREEERKGKKKKRGGRGGEIGSRAVTSPDLEYRPIPANARAFRARFKPNLSSFEFPVLFFSRGFSNSVSALVGTTRPWRLSASQLEWRAPIWFSSFQVSKTPSPISFFLFFQPTFFPSSRPVHPPETLRPASTTPSAGPPKEDWNRAAMGARGR